jgi:hypothetical protein
LYRKANIRKIKVGRQSRETVCPIVSQKSLKKPPDVVSERLECQPRKHQALTFSPSPTGKKKKLLLSEVSASHVTK